MRVVADANVAVAWFLPETMERKAMATVLLTRLREQDGVVVGPDIYRSRGRSHRVADRRRSIGGHESQGHDERKQGDDQQCKPHAGEHARAGANGFATAIA